MFLLNTALERIAVSRACAVMPLEEIDMLRLILIRQKRAAASQDAEEFIDLDDEFHFTIASGAELPMLAKFLSQLRALVRMIGVVVAARPGSMDELVAQHEAIVDALEARDEEAAVAALERHLAHVEVALLGEE